MNSYDNPLEFLRKSIGDKVSVRLRNKTELKGRLVAFDEHLNLMIEDATLKQKEKSQFKTLVYQRGDMILLVGKE